MISRDWVPTATTPSHIFMSKLKSPIQKKQKSYEKDCRSYYGENAKASRKNIPRAKQRSHMAERRVAGEILKGLYCFAEVSCSERVEADLRSKIRIKQVKSFKKKPDLPLLEIIKRKKARSNLRSS
ncbi:hypothetical protein CCP3SC1AL1_160014 [Gammaproteobacteria bacterium]